MKNYSKKRLLTAIMVLGTISANSWTVGVGDTYRYNGFTFQVTECQQQTAKEYIGTCTIVSVDDDEELSLHDFYNFYPNADLNLNFVGGQLYGDAGDNSKSFRLSVTAVGDKAFANKSNLKIVDLSDLVYLEAIGSKAFIECPNLQEVMLPDNVTTIGTSAFEGCKAENLDINWMNVVTIGDYAFAGSNILEFQTTGRTGVIGQAAFRNCKKLEHVRSMGMYYLQDLCFNDYCFSGCTALKTLEISSGTKSIGHMIISGCTSLLRLTAESFTPLDVPEDAFVDSNPDATLRVPEGTEDTYRNAKGWCYFSNISSSDEGAIIEDGLFRYELGDVMGNTSAIITGILSTFEGVAKLPARYVEYEGKLFPVEMIASKTFYGNTKIKGIDLSVLNPTPNDDEYYWWRMEIGDMAFAECSNLKSFKCDVTRNIGEQAFANSGLTSISLPALEYSIGEQAFYKCEDLTTVTIKSNYSPTICPQAFANCPKLRSFNMSDFQGYLMDMVFYGDEALTSIVLPEYLYIFGVQNFSKCKNLRKVTSLNTNPDDIDEDTFLGLPEDAQLFVPEGTVELYKSKAGWKRFGNNIMEKPDVETGIDAVNDDPSEEWYTLDGHKLNGQPKIHGVYVRNEKKVVVK